jgi:hypothetical protein
MELADQQNLEAEGAVAGVEIPSPEPASPVVQDAPEKPLSLRDQILKNVETVRTEEAKRARAADGKFTKLEAGAEQPAAEIPPTEQNAQPTESKPVGPPSGWSKEAQALWEQLPPAVKADAVRREAEVAKGFDEYRAKTTQLSEISQALEPLKPILQQSGIQTEAQAVKRLLEWEGSFRNPQTRMQAFQNLAQTYGVDLSTLVQNPSLAPSSAQEIPEPLRPVLDQFGNVVQDVRRDVSAVQQELQTLRNERVESELRNFAKDKPHFNAVRELMGKLMSAGAAQDLEGAYHQATKIHPEVSAAIEAERVAKAATDLAKANAEKAAKARQAAISPGQRSPSVAPTNSGKAKGSSVRDTLLNSIGELREGQRA